jgi:3-oxoacyl-[acyl-carrier-protein] synthase-1
VDNENTIPNAYICGMGMVTAVGDSALMTAASVRAGINRCKETDVYNKRFHPMKMALVPDDLLAPINGDLESTMLTARQNRMLRLAQPALSEALSGLPQTQDIPLYLSVSESLSNLPQLVDQTFLDHLHVQCNASFDRDHSMLFTTGRAGGLIALEAAMNALTNEIYNVILVGGVDSYLDPLLLGTLDRDDRVSAENVLNGFAPGEGAGFLLLANQQAVEIHNFQPLATLFAPGIASEPGHRFSDEPYKGDGLAEAFSIALENCGNQPVKTIFSSLNGENFGAKEYGVAVIRNKEHLDSNFTLEHPADCFGDIGAAFAPILIGLSSLGLQKGYLQGPVMVYCSSEGEYRGATCVNTI